jgi:hypothetical protein
MNYLANLSNEIYAKRKDRRIKRIKFALEDFLRNKEPEASRWTIFGGMVIGLVFGALIMWSLGVTP